MSQTAQSSAVLGSEWQQLQDDAGRTYYYNTETGVSSWQGPDTVAQYYTDDETANAVTDETAATDRQHQQQLDTVSAAASLAQYDVGSGTTAYSTDHAVELGQLREAVAHIALSQESAEQLMKQHVVDAIAALKSDLEQQLHEASAAAAAGSQTQLSAEVARLQTELTATTKACTVATQSLQADVTAVTEQLQQQQQQHDADDTTAHSLAALQSSLNDRAARAEAVAKALAVQSLKYAREQRDHVMTAVQALEAELQAVRSSSSVSEAAVLQCAAAAVDSKLASFEAAALSAVSAQSGRRSAGSCSGESHVSNFNSDFNSANNQDVTAATATTAGVDRAASSSSVSVAAVAQEQCRLRELLREQDARLSKDIADARSRLTCFLDMYCTAQVLNQI